MPPPAVAKPILLACTSLFWISHYSYVPILPPYAEHQGASFQSIGLIVSAYRFVLLCLRLPLGTLSDRIKRHKSFVTVGLLVAFANARLAWAPSTSAVATMRILSGVSASAWVAFTVLFASYYPIGQTARAMGVITFCNGLSIITGSFLGEVHAETFGWHAPF